MSDEPAEPTLTGLRDQIDEVDAKLVELMGQRFALTREVGALKASQGLPSRDEARESHQHLRLAILAEQEGIDPSMVLRAFDAITDRVVEEHDAMRRGVI